MKTFVAFLAALLVLVGPAAAQDPEPEPSDDQSGQDPEPQPSDPDGNATANEPEPSSASATAPTCPVAKSSIGDPRVPPNQWIILDPHGCLQQIVYKVLTTPPARFVLRHL